MGMLTATITGMDGLTALQAALSPELFAKAERGGITYASKSVAPAVAKAIAASYAISSARIKQDIGQTRFGDGGTTATIPFSRRAPTLRQYAAQPGARGGSQPGLGRGKGWGKPRRKGRPVTATTLRSQGKQRYDSSFFATGKEGNQLVLRRVGRKLKGVYGPSIGSIFIGKSAIAQALQETVGQRISQQFETGYQRVLDAAKRGF